MRPERAATGTVPRAARVGLSVTFALHAAVSGSWGPRLPQLKDGAGASQTELGWILAGFATGLFAGTRLAAWPVSRIGSRATIRIGIVLLAATLVSLAWATSLGRLATTFVILGLVSGGVDVANNAQAISVQRRFGRSVMHRLHGTWSAGALAAAAVSAVAARFDVPLSVHFGVVGAFVIATAFVACRRLLPGTEGIREAEAPPDARRIGLVTLLFLGLLGFSSLLIEAAAADWSAVYLRETLGAGSAVAAVGFVAFASGMTVWRLFLGDRSVSRHDPVTVIRVAGIGVAAGFTLAAVSATPTAIVAFALIGFSVGPVAPTVFSRAGNLRLGQHGTALVWVVTLSYLGSIVGPATIGLVAGRFDLRVALLVPAAFGLVVAAAAGTLRSGGDGLDD
jgi:MFS family permease